MHTVALAAAAESPEVGELITNVVFGEGLAPLLVLVGAILVGFSLAVFGGLTLGAVASLLQLD